RAVAQAMARELGPKNIHVVHLLIDAGVDSEAIHQRMKAAKGIKASEIPADSLTKTSSIAEAYWFAHQQTRDGWTHELDLRPSVEIEFVGPRSEEHTSELQSRGHLVCRLLLEKKKILGCGSRDFCNLK